MANSKLPTLRLKNQETADPSADREIDLGVYDVLLPCRNFLIHHKVAVLGRVSLTAEFLLRLAKMVPGISEDDAATFFGFNRREITFVLRETAEPGYIERREGRLWLTAAGGALFREDNSEPEIFKVEERKEIFGFDLISLAPQKYEKLSKFELDLPELPITDQKKAGAAADGVSDAFGRFYRELADRRDRQGTEKKDLYSIDRVEASGRFLSKVRVMLRAQASRPTVGAGDLSSWRPDHEQDDRRDVVRAISEFVVKLNRPSRDDDKEAYKALLRVAPEFLKDVTRKDGLAVERYYREALERVGELRADRKTVPLLGSLLLKDNLKRLLDALGYGLKDKESVEPRFLFWLAPQAPYWGATALLDEAINRIKDNIDKQVSAHKADDGCELIKSVCLTAGAAARYLGNAFTVVLERGSKVPAAVEIFLVPRIAASVIVHAPIDPRYGLPVPLGIVSFDEAVVARAQNYLRENIGARIEDVDLQNKIASELFVDTGVPPTDDPSSRA